jgi:trehalose 6-phosphate synthase/phosphatase
MWQETDGRQEKKWWLEYVKLNQKFALKIIEMYKPGDLSTAPFDTAANRLVWIHDYFLGLLPEMIKQEIPSAYVGFFMHAPFPSSEYFRCLPSTSMTELL